MGRLRDFLEVRNVEALGSSVEFKEPIRSMYLENTTTIAAIVCIVVLLSKKIK